MMQFIKRRGISRLPFLPVIGVGLFASFVLTFRLASITHGLAAQIEQQSIYGARTWHYVWEFPFYAPYHALLRFPAYIGYSLFYSRLVTVLFGLACIGLFYLIINRWFRWRIACLGTVLFATNSYFLHLARITSPGILQMLVSLGLIALFTFNYRRGTIEHLWLWILALVTMLYVPGAVWLIVAFILYERKRLVATWKQASWPYRTANIAGALVLLAPLLYFLITATLQDRNALTLGDWAGIGLHIGKPAIIAYVETVLSVPVHLFWQGDGVVHPEFGLSNLPVLDLACGALAILGGYVHIRRVHDARWRFNLLLLGLGWLVVGLRGLNRALLVPIIYLCVVVGLVYLLNEWYKVFPRNPVARGLALVAIGAVVTLSSIYNLREYFVAWPHNAATHQAFNCPATLPRPSTCVGVSFDTIE